MKRIFALHILAVVIVLLIVNALATAQTKEETTIKIKKVKVENGDTTMTEQALTPQEFEEMKKNGEFKDLDIQLKKGKAEEKGQKITKEIRVTSKGKHEAGEQVEVEVRASEDGKEVVKTLKGEEAEKRHKHMKHSDCDHKKVEKKGSKEKKVIKKKK